MHVKPEKIIYFVRHGQSVGNVNRAFQNDSDPLTELGKIQAERVAQKMALYSPEIILASPLERAHDTAQAIHKAVQVPVIKDERLREYKVPTSLVFKKIVSPESDKFHKALFANINNPHWRYEDEDNYFDLNERAKEVVESLRTRPERIICVVSHGAFLSIVITTLMNDGVPDPITSARMMRFLQKANTGITTVDYVSNPFITNTWRLRVWNDHSHLSDGESTYF
jgi:probable phosphoglycerate mutase